MCLLFVWYVEEVAVAYKLSFGRYIGKTLEWLFFHDPGYVEFIVGKNIHNDPLKFTSSERHRFNELYRRASLLKIPGLCTWCKKRPITRMFLTEHPSSGGLVGVAFDCDSCAPQGSSYSIACKPAFFPPNIFRNYDKMGGRFLVKAIKRAYFKNSSCRMTQKRMESFFNDPKNFVNF